MSLLFIFDMDDVLYNYDWRVRMAGMTELTGLSLAELRERWWHDDGEWAGEAGVFETPEAYLNSFSAAIGVKVDEDDWVRVRGAAMAVRPDALAAVRRASTLGTITLLTNNNALTAKHLHTLAPELVDIFGDHMLTSSHYRARKPNPIVFERVLAAYETAPENAFSPTTCWTTWMAPVRSASRHTTTDRPQECSMPSSRSLPPRRSAPARAMRPRHAP